VPVQHRLASASRHLPDSDGAVVAATCCDLLAIWTEANSPDTPVKCSIVSTHHTFENKQEQDTVVTYHACSFNDPIWVPVSTSQIRIKKFLFPIAPPPHSLSLCRKERSTHTERTGSLCPLNVELRDAQTGQVQSNCGMHKLSKWHVPVDVSQILTTLEFPPLATCLTSGLKQTLETVL
jgi:hypothetical protein